jgi:hypothetical protein
MDAIFVVVDPEIFQFALQVDGVPDEHVIKELASNRADQSFHERMGHGNARDRLDLLDLQNAQVGRPTVVAKEWVVVGTQVPRSRLAGDDLAEHPTNRNATKISALNGKADDPASTSRRPKGQPLASPAVAAKAWITRDENSNNAVRKLSDPRHRKILIYLALAIPPLGTTTEKWL